MRPLLALYIGGMGARGKNFYTSLAGRYGYERQAAVIQDLYLDGRKQEAAAAVPADLVDAVSLVGPRTAVAERIETLRKAGVTTLKIAPLEPGHPAQLAAVTQLREILG